jgi:hypothetical protein
VIASGGTTQQIQSVDTEFIVVPHPHDDIGHINSATSA